MILVELVFGIVVAGIVLLLLPVLLIMAGVGAAVLLWLVASAGLLGVLIFWLVFPGAHGLAILMFVLAIGLFFVDRRVRRNAP